MADEQDRQPSREDHGQDGQEQDGGQQSDEKKGGQKSGKPDEKKEEKKEEPKRPAVWPWIAGGLILLGFIAVVLFEIFVPKPDVWTNDAYVTVHYATIAPRVSGQVTQVLVNDNQQVVAGQELVQLDPRDFETAVAQAEATLARDTAQVATSSADVSRQPAIIVEGEAEVARIQAQLNFAQQDQARYRNLAATGAGTGQQHQQADANLAAMRAQLRSAQASVDASKEQLRVLKTQVSRSEGTVKLDEAMLRQAQLNLSYTHVRAPLEGVVGTRTIQVGDYVSPGMTTMTVVPLDRVFIEANYRELALRHMRIGQAVTIHVDAYNIDLAGVVDSLPPASNAVFAPIAPENATGNFTKIVQRLPVKIIVNPDQPLYNLLKPGLSVETTVHTALANVVGAQQAHPDALITR
ncbi:MAG: HlyD family secretion protein [Gluconacetobacter diazotrophicus]|nr:HlyD family secretion protein [Gluconacetobacter diazotrophicus]